MPLSQTGQIEAALACATKHRWVTLIVQTAGIGFACTLLFVYTKSMQDQRIQLAFETEAVRSSNRIVDNLRVYEEVVRSISSFYAGSDAVSRGEFNAFVGRTLTQHSGIHALEWVPRVSSNSRSSFEQQARRDGLEDFQFKRFTSENKWTSSAEDWTDQYFPVFYMQPHVGNEQVLGIDMASNPTRLAAMNTARDTGQPIATAAMSLVAEDHDPQVGFLLFVPIYQNEATVETVEQRRQSLEGFALGVFRVRDIVGCETQVTLPNFASLRVIDEDEKELHCSFSGAEGLDKNDSRFQHTEYCTIGGRSWKLEFTSSNSWLKAHRGHIALQIGVGGGCLASLLGVILMAQLGRTENVECLIRDRTADLKYANRMIQHHSEELQTAKHVLEQSNQQLKEFAYATSHDLQTPLRGIASFAAFLKDEFQEQLDETGNEYVNRIITSAERMRNLILDLLEYSQVESQSSDLQPTCLNSIVDTALALLDSEIERRNGVVTRDHLPMVQGDAQQMSQLFRNLISNGLKYQGDAPPRIHISAEIAATCTIQVQDNGIGIDPRFEDQIFDIFRRLHTQQEYPGTGIGLALCRRIVHRHGGTIHVTSALGHGSKFVFTMPAAAILRATTVRGPKFAIMESIKCQ